VRRDCVVPVSPGGHLQPLAPSIVAVPGCGERLLGGEYGNARAIPQLRAVPLPMPSATPFQNLNTPEQWNAHRTAFGKP